VNTQEFDKSPRARIGIIATPGDCQVIGQSRIGFGTTGEYLGMDPLNSCGNEQKSNSSMRAFGYIFVQ